jgi:hypothetical protein
MAEIKTSINISSAVNWITSALTTSLGAGSPYIQGFEDDQIRKIARHIKHFGEEFASMTEDDRQAEIENIQDEVDGFVESVKAMKAELREKTRQAICNSIADNLGKILGVAINLV